MSVLKLRGNQNTPIDCSDYDNNLLAVLDRGLHIGTQLAGTISDLYTTVKNYDFITELQQCCEDLTQQLQDLQDSIFGDGELSTIINNLRNELLLEIAELQNELNTFTLRVSAAETNIATINSSLTSLSSSITGLANSKANIASPTFTGVPKAPTPSLSGADPTQIATVGYITSVGSSFLPIGIILPYGGNVLPNDNFMFANGQAINRVTYAALFALFGITYGTGDGISTFNLPNLQQKVPVGVGDSFTLGDTGGASTHTLTTNEMPTHNHTADHTHTITDPGHNHSIPAVDTIPQPSDNQFAVEGQNDYGNTPITVTGTRTTGITINYTSGLTTSNHGSGQPHNNMQPYIVLNYIVKVK